MTPYTPQPCRTFPPGPWSDEPNLVGWTDPETEYECCIIRHGESGHLCGYVRVPPDHSLADKEYDSRIPIPKGWMEREVNVPQDIGYFALITASIQMDEETAAVGLLIFWHGGLTYGSGNGWFGFDCAHAGDWSPYRSEPIDGGKYRTVAYAKAECKRLAKQLWEYEHLAGGAR